MSLCDHDVASVRTMEGPNRHKSGSAEVLTATSPIDCAVSEPVISSSTADEPVAPGNIAYDKATARWALVAAEYI